MPAQVHGILKTSTGEGRIYVGIGKIDQGFARIFFSYDPSRGVLVDSQIVDTIRVFRI